MDRVKVKTSRISFIKTYITTIFLVFLWLFLGLVIGLPDILNFFFIILIVYFLLRPEMYIFYQSYFVESEKVFEVKGIIAKKQSSIPMVNIAFVELEKGVFGRLFKFGDIKVTSSSGEKMNLILKGIKHPDKLLKNIEERMEKAKKGKKDLK